MESSIRVARVGGINIGASAAGLPVTVDGDGATVLDVVDDAPATGVLEPGDVITAVNGEPVRTAPALREALRGLGSGATVTLTVERPGGSEASIPEEVRMETGFAIPSPLVVDVANELLSDGHADHPFLGVTPITLTPELAEQYGIETDGGVLLLDVEPGGPADAAGIEPGDVIVRFGDDDVLELGDLLSALRASDPGDDVELTVLRDGREQTVEVELGRVDTGTRPGGG